MGLVPLSKWCKMLRREREREREILKFGMSLCHIDERDKKLKLLCGKCSLGWTMHRRIVMHVYQSKSQVIIFALEHVSSIPNSCC